jgi:16S rRNA (cytidine1402-2'-O)-methyltransferase
MSDESENISKAHHHDSRKAMVYVVATPIGNLEDLTPRARRILEEVDIVAAEDTRVARKLLSAFNINKKEVISYYDEVEEKRAKELIDRIQTQNLSLALISDAGTPAISDPGAVLVREAVAAQIPVVPVGGISAVTTVLSASPFAGAKFTFVGFLPAKESDVTHEIDSWAALPGVVVFFYPVRKLSRTLAKIVERFPNAQVTIGRELTKMYEEILSASISEALSWAENHDLRGEAVVVLKTNAGADSEQELDLDKLFAQAQRLLRKGRTVKDLLEEFKDLPISRKNLYQLLLKAKLEL